MAVVVQFVCVLGYFLLTQLSIVKFYQQEVIRNLYAVCYRARPSI
jgi:hypothetical protein